MDLNLSSVNNSKSQLKITPEEKYNGLSNLAVQTFVPIISGFQSQKVLGFYGHIADPVINRDLTFEIGDDRRRRQALHRAHGDAAAHRHTRGDPHRVDHNATD